MTTWRYDFASPISMEFLSENCRSSHNSPLNTNGVFGWFICRYFGKKASILLKVRKKLFSDFIGKIFSDSVISLGHNGCIVTDLNIERLFTGNNDNRWVSMDVILITNDLILSCPLDLLYFLVQICYFCYRRCCFFLSLIGYFVTVAVLLGNRFVCFFSSFVAEILRGEIIYRALKKKHYH